jgi:nucleotide-binding universal stress UspA family protein
LRSGQPPEDAIVQAAMRYRAELIILGSHGRTGMRRRLRGSVTARVIATAPGAVMVVKRMI